MGSGATQRLRQLKHPEIEPESDQMSLNMHTSKNMKVHAFESHVSDCFCTRIRHANTTEFSYTHMIPMDSIWAVYSPQKKGYSGNKYRKT